MDLFDIYNQLQSGTDQEDDEKSKAAIRAGLQSIIGDTTNKSGDDSIQRDPLPENLALAAASPIARGIRAVAAGAPDILGNEIGAVNFPKIGKTMRRVPVEVIHPITGEVFTHTIEAESPEQVNAALKQIKELAPNIEARIPSAEEHLASLVPNDDVDTIVGKLRRANEAKKVPRMDPRGYEDSEHLIEAHSSLDPRDAEILAKNHGSLDDYLKNRESLRDDVGNIDTTKLMSFLGY